MSKKLTERREGLQKANTLEKAITDLKKLKSNLTPKEGKESSKFKRTMQFYTFDENSHWVYVTEEKIPYQGIEEIKDLTDKYHNLSQFSHKMLLTEVNETIELLEKRLEKMDI